jgi:diadenosine tetraphosphatase ApaH/serine/threonine PP2A family protein phosphatase
MDILMRESNVLFLSSPITVVGDVHGQILDLFKMFRKSGNPGEVQYLMLGDYVDRGYSSIETFMYLAIMKILNPDRVFLLRGNHESRSVNQMYGLLNECNQAYGHSGIWFLLNRVFDLLPIAAVIDNSWYCVHGGLSPDLRSIGKIISEINRRQEVPPNGPFADLLWSDPDDVQKFSANRRGAGYIFGRGEVSQFLHLNKMKVVARSHQLAMNGYTWMFDNTLVTVWSAPNYMYRSGNKASVLKLDGDAADFIVFKEDEKSSRRPDDLIVSYFA